MERARNQSRLVIRIGMFLIALVALGLGFFAVREIYSLWRANVEAREAQELTRQKMSSPPKHKETKPK